MGKPLPISCFPPCEWLFGRQDAALYGRQGCLPLHFQTGFETGNDSPSSFSVSAALRRDRAVAESEGGGETVVMRNDVKLLAR
jgi:hypothetical protein